MGAITKLISKISWPYKRKVLEPEIKYFNTLASDGDIYITYRPWQLGNLFIPGGYDHVGIKIGNYIVDATVENGVSKTLFKDWISTYKKYKVLHPTFCSKEEAKAAGEYALELIGRDYDKTFELDPSELYCSELIWFAYIFAANKQCIEPSQLFNHEIIYPADFDRSSMWNIDFFFC